MKLSKQIYEIFENFWLIGKGKMQVYLFTVLFGTSSSWELLQVLIVCFSLIDVGAIT